MTRTRGILSLAALGLALGLAVPAQAQFGLPKLNVNLPGGDEKISAADKAFRAGMQALPDSYGQNAEEEAKKVKEAEAQLKAGKDKLSSDVKMHARFKDVDKQRADLEAEIAQAKLQLPCSVARGEIRATHVKGELATDAQLKKLDEAVDALSKGVAPNHKNQLEWWQSEAKRCRENNAEYARSAKAEAARKDAQKLAAKMREVAGYADKLLKEFSATIGKAENALPDGDIAKYKSEIEKIKGVSPAAVAYYNTELHYLQYYNAWFKAEGEIPAAVAAALDAQVVASGVSEGKKLSVSVAAKKDMCYAIVSRWKAFAGQEGFVNDEASAKDAGALQSWYLFRSGWGWQKWESFCVTGDTGVSYTSDLKFAGSTNGVRYVVVSWAKDKFPVWLAGNISRNYGDPCDSEYWKALWTNGVPGGLVWGEKEPYYVTRNDSGSWITAINLTGQEVRIQKNQVSHKAPAKRTIATAFSFPGCAKNGPATDPESKKVRACAKAIDDKYDPLFDKYAKEKEYAKTINVYQNAKKKLDELPAQRDKEYDAKCTPVQKKLETRFETVFNALADEFQSKGPSDRLDVPGYWLDVMSSNY